MCQYFKPISISLSPNTEKDDVRLALKLLFQPWKWKISINQLNQHKSAVQELENEFARYFSTKYAFSFNSGRSAFMAILQSLGLNRGDEVLLQAFTCNAAVNPIIWAGLNPVFIDCNEDDFNIDIEDLKRKLSHSASSGQTPKSRVVVVQHTFGLPAQMDEILKICEQNGSASSPQDNLILIEDCAHSFGTTYKDKQIGTFGKAAFFSFSRDKVISSVYGGMVITNDEEVASKIKEFQEKCDYPSCCWICQQLLHPVLMNCLILPTYNFLKLGKIILILFQVFRILSKAVHWKEKRGKKPNYFPRRMPNALALLALNQFRKLERFNNHRKKIADFYYQELKNTSFELPLKFPGRENIFLRFTVKHKNAHQIIWQAWQKQNILIGDWYTTPVAPYDTKLEKIQYTAGSCPKAEKLSKITLNLPTHINISPKDAQKIVNFLRKF